VLWTSRRPVVGGHYSRRFNHHGRRSRACPGGLLTLNLLLDGVDTPAWRDELRHASVEVAALCGAL